MTSTTRRVLFWTAWILSIPYVVLAFAVGFASFLWVPDLTARAYLGSDYGVQHPFIGKLVGLLALGFVPGVLLALLITVWRWSWIGGVILLGGIGWYFMSPEFRYMGNKLVLAGPAIIAGVLFLVHWWLCKELRTRPDIVPKRQDNG